MSSDSKTAGIGGDGHTSQDLDSLIGHPGVATLQDGKEEDIEHSRESIRSQSTESMEPLSEAKDAQLPAKRSKSKSSSTRSRLLTVVPRSKRRGLLASLSLLPEVDQPRDYKRSTKWLITMLVSLAGAAGPMGSSIFLPALPQLSADLGITATTSNLSVAVYMLSMAIFPLWWSSFSETLGRRTIYLTAFGLMAVFSIASAESTSVSMLIVMRLLQGGSSAAVQAVGAGSIADIWDVVERGRAMGFFYLGPLMGPLLAPIIGGAMSQKWGWRSTQWFLAIYGGCLLIVLTFCLPETLARRPEPQRPVGEIMEPNLDLARISTTQSIQIRTKKAAAIFKRCFIDPLSVLIYLRFPAVAIVVYLASVSFASLYCLNISVQEDFSAAPYNFSVLIVGLLYIPNSVGYLIASVTGGRWTDLIMQREARKAGRYDSNGSLVYIPEDRLKENAWIAAAIFPGALVWYGWTVDKGVMWVVPIVANFFFGIGSMIIFGCTTTMLTEFMPKRSSSGVAVNNFIRNTCAAIAVIVTAPILSAIGPGWLFTGLGVICWISALVVIWSMKRFGPSWRIEMDKQLN